YVVVARDIRDWKFDQLRDRTPGYPLLLRLAGAAESPSRSLFQVSMLLHFSSIWLLACALRAAGLPEVMLQIFAFLLVLPPYVEPAGYVMTENLAQFVLALAVTCLVFWFLSLKSIWLLLAALAIAYSGLTRPAYLALAFAISGCAFLLPILFRRSR